MPARPEQPQLTREDNPATGVTFVNGIERGMVFWGRVASSQAEGSEHRHDDPCPWVVLSSNRIHQRLPLVQAAPLTSKTDKAAFFRISLPASKRTDYRILSGEVPLTKDSLVLTEQNRALAHERLLGNPVAIVSAAALAEIEAALKYVLDLA